MNPIKARSFYARPLAPQAALKVRGPDGGERSLAPLRKILEDFKFDPKLRAFVDQTAIEQDSHIDELDGGIALSLVISFRFINWKTFRTKTNLIDQLGLMAAERISRTFSKFIAPRKSLGDPQGKPQCFDTSFGTVICPKKNQPYLVRITRLDFLNHPLQSPQHVLALMAATLKVIAQGTTLADMLRRRMKDSE